MTPTGVTLTLESMPQPTTQYETIATLVADRVFELAAATAPGVNMSGDVNYDQLKRAIEKMLAEKSITAQVHWA